MTLYLLDEKVLRELHANGNANVRKWMATVKDSDLRLSAITLFEKRRGWDKRRRSDPELAKTKHAELDALEAAYAGRIVPIDEKVAAAWSALLGAKEKNQRDRALAATALVHGLVIATRNVDDFQGCGVHVLNPFSRRPSIVTV